MRVEDLKAECGRVLAALQSMREALPLVPPLCRVHWPLDITRATPASPGSALDAISGLDRWTKSPGEWDFWPWPKAGADDVTMDLLYAFFRMAVKRTDADAIIFGTEADDVRSTKQQRELLSKSGWNAQANWIGVIGQTREAVYLGQRPYRTRSGTFQWGELLEHEMPQSALSARLKMWDTPRHEAARAVRGVSYTGCDFCGSTLPEWSHECQDFDQGALYPGGVGVKSVGAWLACSGCHSAITAEDWHTLAERGTLNPSAVDIVEILGEERAVQELARMYHGFRAHRTGVVTRLTEVEEEE